MRSQRLLEAERFTAFGWMDMEWPQKMVHALLHGVFEFRK